MKLFIISLFSIVILNGCSLRGFQPPPESWEYFYKNKKGDTTYENIGEDMKKCGFDNTRNNGDFFRKNPNAFINAHLCMENKGYKNYSMSKGVCHDEYFGKYCS